MYLNCCSLKVILTGTVVKWSSKEEGPPGEGVGDINEMTTEYLWFHTKLTW